jgi:pimeloyl-ACP methyl ester carboxylesterase
MPRTRLTLLTGALGAIIAAGLAAVPTAAVSSTPAKVPVATAPAPTLDWTPCGDGLECVTAQVPLDHDKPGGRTIELAVMRHPAADQAHRIGSVFVNPGGPGVSGLDLLRTAPPGALDLFPRFDFVSWDPRGIGESRPLVDCLTDEEKLAPFAGFTRPATADRARLVAQARAFTDGCERRNPEILPHLSTANTARDLDLLRAAVGDEQLTYVGLSHGTHIGATYASLFPDRVRAMVADAPIDADAWVNHRREGIRELASANERGLMRFFTACAVAGSRCGFGGEDPEKAFEALTDAADRAPVPAPSSASGAPVSGDELRLLSITRVISKSWWPLLARALSGAADGHASLARDLLDGGSTMPDGTLAPVGAFFTTTAADARTSRRIDDYLDEGRHLYTALPHNWWQGLEYDDLTYATYRVRDHDAFRGPWTHPAAATPALVIGATHDARTPYRWAERYVEQLGNARLLTYDADRHGALTDLNPCVVGRTIAYITDLTLPEPGAVCAQHYPAFPGESSRGRVPEPWGLSEPAPGLG